jgi:hypothetical protein
LPFVNASLDESGLPTETIDSVDLRDGCARVVRALCGVDIVDTVALAEWSLSVSDLPADWDKGVDFDGSDLVRRKVLGVRRKGKLELLTVADDRATSPVTPVPLRKTVSLYRSTHLVKTSWYPVLCHDLHHHPR